MLTHLFKLILILIVIKTVLTQSPKSKVGVIGGEDSFGDQCDHYASMFITCEGQTGVCGCSFLTPTKLITAAHCVCGFDKYTVCHGGNKCGKKARQCIETSEAYYHPDFVTALFAHGKFKHDVAVLILPHAFDVPVKTVTLPPASMNASNFVGQSAYACGCGAIDGSTKKLPENVQTGRNLVVGTEEAKKAGFNYNEKDKLIWAYGAGVDKFGTEKSGGTCSGDSGGPLLAHRVASDSNSTEFSVDDTYQIGAVSFGASDCNRNSPIAYSYLGGDNLQFILSPQTYNCTNMACGFEKMLQDVSPAKTLKIMNSLKNGQMSPPIFNCKFTQMVTSFGYLIPGIGGIPIHNEPVSKLTSLIFGA